MVLYILLFNVYCIILGQNCEVKFNDTLLTYHSSQQNIPIVSYSRKTVILDNVQLIDFPTLLIIEISKDKNTVDKMIDNTMSFGGTK